MLPLFVRSTFFCIKIILYFFTNNNNNNFLLGGFARRFHLHVPQCFLNNRKRRSHESTRRRLKTRPTHSQFFFFTFFLYYFFNIYSLFHSFLVQYKRDRLYKITNTIIHVFLSICICASKLHTNTKPIFLYVYALCVYVCMDVYIYIFKKFSIQLLYIFFSLKKSSIFHKIQTFMHFFPQNFSLFAHFFAFFHEILCINLSFLAQL